MRKKRTKEGQAKSSLTKNLLITAQTKGYVGLNKSCQPLRMLILKTKLVARASLLSPLLTSFFLL